MNPMFVEILRRLGATAGVPLVEGDSLVTWVTRSWAACTTNDEAVGQEWPACRRVESDGEVLEYRTGHGLGFIVRGDGGEVFVRLPWEWRSSYNGSLSVAERLAIYSCFRILQDGGGAGGGADGLAGAFSADTEKEYASIMAQVRNVARVASFSCMSTGLEPQELAILLVAGIKGPPYAAGRPMRDVEMFSQRVCEYIRGDKPEFLVKEFGGDLRINTAAHWAAIAAGADKRPLDEAMDEVHASQ